MHPARECQQCSFVRCWCLLAHQLQYFTGSHGGAYEDTRFGDLRGHKLLGQALNNLTFDSTTAHLQLATSPMFISACGLMWAPIGRNQGEHAAERPAGGSGGTREGTARLNWDHSRGAREADERHAWRECPGWRGSVADGHGLLEKCPADGPFRGAW